jgi:hypothetical protein
MSARKGALTAPIKDRPTYCHDCEQWPAPVQFAPNTRLCEECAAKRRHPAGSKVAHAKAQ